MQHKGWHTRGYLPHLDAGGVVQAVTFRLADSLPAAVVTRLKLQAQEDGRKLRSLAAVALDAGMGACTLRKPEAAGIVENALLHFDGQRYRLLAWVVMPNPVHVVLEQWDGWPLGGIVRSWKSFSARRIGLGLLWQPDYFDRRIRDDEHLVTAIRYVHDNPVKAGLCERPEDWRFSSAWGARLETRGPG